MNYELVEIARTGKHFSDFGPYVPAIANGHVAFYAAREGGRGMIVLAAPEGGARRPFGELVPSSHPDLIEENGTFTLAVFVQGEQLWVKDGQGTLALVQTAPTGAELRAIGVAGPVIHQGGIVAFRADRWDGHDGIYTRSRGEPLREVCASDSPFLGDRRRPGACTPSFEGMPVINSRGTVLFRANDADGGALLAWSRRGGPPELLLPPTADFAEISRFPCLDDEDRVYFSGRPRGGHPGIYCIHHGEIRAVSLGGLRFQSLRGVICSGTGVLVWYGAPLGGTLGVYGFDGAGGAERLIGFGDVALGSTVTDLALNPVSIDDQARVAMRLAFADGVQRVVRWEPATPPSPASE